MSQLNHIDNLKEIWKPIPGYEGIYEASSWGRIKSLERYAYCKNGRKFKLHEKIMNQFLSPQGYYAIVLKGEGKNPARYGVHRLIAKTFIKQDNPEKNHIDHIDGNPLNNTIFNLRWVTRTENMHNPITEARIDAAIGRTVIRLAPDGSTKEYHQIKDVEKDGFNRHKVCTCCGGHRLFHGGYVWVYKGDKLHDFDFYLKEKHKHYSEAAKNRRVKDGRR